jgi:hypothetical protein
MFKATHSSGDSGDSGDSLTAATFEALRQPCDNWRQLVDTIRAERAGAPAHAALHGAEAEDAVDHFTERAAIAEYDGYMERSEADEFARKAVFGARHAYHFTLADIPDEAPVVICDEPTVEAAQRSLESRFGEGRIIACWRVGEVRP